MSAPFSGSRAISLPGIGATAVRSDLRAKLHEQIAAAFDEFRAPLLRYLRTFGLEIQDGEEVLQEVFLALFRDLDSGKRIESVRPWLFRVAHNLALRRRYRARRDAETQLESGGAEHTADPSPNPEDRLARLQIRERVSAVVDALPEQDRRCLFLRAEGLRYREIGEILDMSLGAVSSSITRTLARIARAGENRRPL